MKHIWATMTVGAALVMATPVMADVKTGVDAWQQGDYAKAIGEWRPLALDGDPDAQFNMGQAYKLGRGVQPDLKTATDWYRKAAAQGHMRAEDNLGLLLFQQGDRTAAMPFLERAANRGEPRAQYIVGTAMFNGDLSAKDWVRAYAYMTRASSSGLAQATTSLEQMDKYIPEGQRKQGLALAAQLETSEKSGALASAAPIAVQSPIVRPAPSPVKSAPLPASTVKQTPAPIKTSPSVKAVPKPEAGPPTPAAKPGSWRVQLGAFGEESRARAQWRQLTGKVSGLSAYQLYIVKAGAIIRLQAGPLATGDDAARLCAAVKRSGADCMPKKM